MNSVFISYGRADGSDFALRLRADLESRGHRTWLDIDSLGKGSLFEVRIEQGIRSASVVAAVLTPQSVREDSVCRDEVVFALNEGKSIVPLRAHPQVQPTLLLARRNWIDFTRDYGAALAALVRFLDGDEGALVPPPLASIGGVAPLDFGPEIARYSTNFTGRAWIGSEIDAWLARRTNGACLVVGEPGVGKSALAAWLCLHRPEVVGIHFCTQRSSRSLDPAELTASLVTQLHARLPGYAQQVERRRTHVPRARASDAFRELIVEPARELESDPVLVVIDSLDEAAGRIGETIVDVLAEQAPDLPAWLRIVATTRPDARVIERLRVLHTIPLSSGSDENRQDLLRYCETQIGRSGRLAADIANRLAALADGNFLYARMALDALESGAMEPGELGTLTPGLADFYGFTFRRLFPDTEAFARVDAGLLTALVAARGPLTLGTLALASQLEPEAVHRRLRHLQSQLRSSRGGQTLAFSLFHPSLRDWLVDPDLAGEYWCPEIRGHEHLATALAGKWLEDEYALRHLPAHLVAAGRVEDAVELLVRLEFIERKCRGGMTSDLLADFHLVRLALVHPVPELLDFARFVRRRAHVLAVEPGRTRSEAALEPEAGAPSRVARAGGGPRGPWIDWVNRPRAHDAALMTLRGHHGAVTVCLFDAGGDVVLSGSEDGSLKIWDHQTGAMRVALAGPSPVRGAAWVADGRVASVADDGVVRVWDTRTAIVVASWVAHGREATCCAVSPDGRLIVTGSKDRTLCVWTLDGGELVARLARHNHGVTSCAFATDGRRLISSADHHGIAVWDTATWEPVELLSGHTRAVTACAFSPDGTRFASASDDRTIVVWDAVSLQPVLTLSGHRKAVLALAWSEGAAGLASGSADRTVRLWDRAGTEAAVLVGHSHDVRSVAVSAKAPLIASGSKDGTVTLWDAVAARESDRNVGQAGAIHACSLSPDGRELATGFRDGTVGVWDTRSGEQVARLAGHGEAVVGCAWSADGQHLMSASLDNTLRLWSRLTGAEQLRVAILGQGVTCCDFSPDGRLGVAGGGDGFGSVRDLGRGRQIVRLAGHASGIRGCAFSPDGRSVATASWDATVRIWDAWTGACRHVLAGHEGSVTACAFSPDARRLISCGDDGTIRLWDALGGAQIGKVADGNVGVTAGAFLPDGQRVVGAFRDGGVRVFDIGTGDLVAAFLGEATVQAIAVGPGSLLGGGDALGRPLILRLLGAHAVSAAATPTRVFRNATGEWDGVLTLRCPWCGTRSVAPGCGGAASCPECHQHLEVTSFVVDARDALAEGS